MNLSPVLTWRGGIISAAKKGNRYGKAKAHLEDAKPGWRERGYRIFRFDAQVPR